MDKASGVYLTIKDSSFFAGGYSNLKCFIPMLTTKGKIGLNYVTAANVDEVVGYNDKYNPLYIGLKRILEKLNYAYVLRINQNAKLANAYWNNSSVTSQANVTGDIESLTTKTFAVACKTPGNPVDQLGQKLVARFDFQTTNVAAENKKGEIYTITVPSVNTSLTYSLGATSGLIKGVRVYDASGNLVGVCKNVSGTFNLYTYDSSNGTIGTDIIGTYSGTTVTINANKEFSTDSSWIIKCIPSTATELVAEFGVTSNSDAQFNNVSITETYSFSLDSTSDDYWESVDFGSFAFTTTATSITSSNAAMMNAFGSWKELANGDNGSTINSINVNELPLSELDGSECNICAMNGITEVPVINRIANKCITNKIHVFVDAPAYGKYTDIASWKASLIHSEYVAVCARPDQTTDSTLKTVYIYPSVNYVAIYADMLSSFGYLNYPPAGFTYGNITVDNLIDCDFEMFKDEMKTNRINWQRVTNNGTCIWEQRTTYSLDTDLSYIAPVFIVQELGQQIVEFEQNFNFRYMTRSDLLTQQSGLTAILNNFVSNGFIYSYELDVPDYDTAQKSGRTLKIKVKVQVMKDSEVIELELELTNG